MVRLLFLFGLCAAVSAASSKVNSALIPHVSCAVCEIMASEIAVRLNDVAQEYKKGRVPEDVILTALEDLCDPLSDTSEWVVSHDIVADGDSATLKYMGVPGVCKGECRLLQETCNLITDQAPRFSGYLHTLNFRGGLDKLMGDIRENLCTVKPSHGFRACPDATDPVHPALPPRSTSEKFEVQGRAQRDAAVLQQRLNRQQRDEQFDVMAREDLDAHLAALREEAVAAGMTPEQIDAIEAEAKLDAEHEMDTRSRAKARLRGEAAAYEERESGEDREADDDGSFAPSKAVREAEREARGWGVSEVDIVTADRNAQRRARYVAALKAVGLMDAEGKPIGTKEDVEAVQRAGKLARDVSHEAVGAEYEREYIAMLAKVVAAAKASGSEFDERRADAPTTHHATAKELDEISAAKYRRERAELSAAQKKVAREAARLARQEYVDEDEEEPPFGPEFYSYLRVHSGEELDEL